MATDPGVPSPGTQQAIVALPSMGATLGVAHHVAARSGTPPSAADTICQGGTCRLDGLEIRPTALDTPMRCSLCLDRPSVGEMAAPHIPQLK